MRPQNPPGTHGDPTLIRVGLPLLRQDPRDCPHELALRARPLLRQTRDKRWPTVKDFSLDPLMKVLDSVEHQKKELQKALAQDWPFRGCHPMHRLWVRDSAPTVLAARARMEAVRRADGHPATLPVQSEWVATYAGPRPDARGAQFYERCAWGRRYASADGSVREIWLLSPNSPRLDRTPAEIAAAASVAATGVRARKSSETGRYAPVGQNVAPRRVRIIGVGCGTGETVVLADWDVQEASRRYEELAKPALAHVVGRADTVPGSSCVRCKALESCRRLPVVPGLLGVPALASVRERRSVSVSDLRRHAECPAAFQMTRVLKLRDAHSESAAIRRGRAVDAELNARHLRRSAGGCRDLPVTGPPLDVPADKVDAATRMLDQHRAICPLDGLPTHEEVRVQPRVTAYDPTLDAVVIADPDLLYTDAGGWVWRETKTAASAPWEGRSLLETYPQLALAVVMMSSGILGGEPERSRIELEVLLENDAICEWIAPFDGPTIEEARSVVAALVGPWANDESYPTRPGRHCDGCEVRRWCPSGQSASPEGTAR